MSRRHGRIEMAIATALMGGLTRSFTVRELAEIAYPDAREIEKRHRVAIIRAVDKVAFQLGWTVVHTVKKPTQSIFVNLLSVRSFIDAEAKGAPAAGSPADRARQIAAWRARREAVIDAEGD